MDGANGTSNKESDEGQRADIRIIARSLALKNFTSQWFLAPQGTGIIATILHQLPYQFHGLAIISQCFWVLTIVMLCMMLLVYIARAAIYPSHVRQQLQRDFMETACLSSISIAFTTIIQMIPLNLIQWNQGWGTVAYVLWWINLPMAVGGCIGIFYVFTSMEASGFDNVPAAIRLPVISVLTIAAGGGVICRYGQLSANLQVPIIITSYLCVGLGIFLALLCDAALMMRLLDHSWPAKQQIFTVMIACGPWGQASFAMQILGNAASVGAFANYHAQASFINATAGTTVSTCGILLALLLWGYGTFWWSFSIIGILHEFASNPKSLLQWDRHLSAWALVFPWVRMSMDRLYHCTAS